MFQALSRVNYKRITKDQEYLTYEKGDAARISWREEYCTFQ